MYIRGRDGRCVQQFLESEWGRKALSAACVPTLTATANEVKKNYENNLLPQLRAAMQGVCVLCANGSANVDDVVCVMNEGTVDTTI